MFVNLLALNEVIQLQQGVGRYLTTDNETVQQFQFSVYSGNEDTHFSFKTVDQDVEIQYKICGVQSETCDQVNYQMIQQQDIITQHLESGDYILNIINVKKSSVQIFVDQAQIIEQYRVYDFEAGINHAQFLYYSCTSDQVSIQSYFGAHLNATVHFSREGYAETETCVNSTQQFCNINVNSEQQTQQTLDQGLWRISVYFLDTEEMNQIAFSQNQLNVLKLDGKITQLDLSLIRTCYQFGVLDFTEFLNPDDQQYFQKQISMMSFVATHIHQYILGNTEVATIDCLPYTENNVYMSKTNSFAQYDVWYAQMKIKDGSIKNNKIYVRFGQVQQARNILTETNINTTTINILPMYNVKLGTSGMIEQSTFTYPVPKNTTNSSIIEQSTRRLLYNFYNDLVDITGYKNFDGEELTANLNYAFMAVDSGFDTEVKIAVDNLENDITSNAVNITTDSGVVGEYIEYKMANQTDLANNEIERLSPIYFTCVYWAKDSQQAYPEGYEPVYIPIMEDNYDYENLPQELQAAYINQGFNFQIANILVGLEPNSMITFATQSGKNSLQMKIKVTEEAKQQKEITVSMRSTIKQKPQLFWSKVNPLVSSYDYYQNATYNEQFPNNLQITIPIEEGDEYVYVQAYNRAKCPKNVITIFTKDKQPTLTKIQTETEIEIEPQEELKFMISVSNIEDRNLFLRTEINSSSIKGLLGLVPMKFKEDGTYEQNDDVLQAIYLDSAISTKSISQFNYKESGYIYLTYMNVGTTVAKLNFQVSDAQILVNGVKKTIEVNEQNSPELMVKIEHNQVFSIETQCAAEEQVQVYICPYTIPLYSKIDECYVQTVGNGTVALKQNTKYSGNVFLKFVSSSVDFIKTDVTVIINQVVNINSAVELRLSTVKYIQVTLDQMTLLQLRQGNDVSVCASFSEQHPQICEYEFSGEGNKQFIEVTEEKILYIKLTPKTPSGISTDCLLTIDEVIMAQLGSSSYTMQYKPIKVAEGEYSNHLNLIYTINTTEIDPESYSSLLVYPDKANPQDYFETELATYISFTDPIANYQNAELTAYSKTGSTVITIENSMIQQYADENNITKLYVGASLLESNILKQKLIYFDLEITAQDKTLYTITPGSGKNAHNTFFMGSANQSKVAVYNTTFLPNSFILEPCVGDPTFRAGYTNFYETFSIDQNVTKDGMFPIWSNKNREQQEPTYFTARASTQFALKTTYFLQIGDAQHDWKARMYIGNSDPRPGAPIRSFDLSVKNDIYTADFYPAISPISLNREQHELKYALFAIQDLEDNQVSGPNPKCSCGFLHGYQLNEFTKLTGEKLQLQTSADKFQEIQTQLNEYGNYYLTIVVRDELTNMTNLYEVKHYKSANLQFANLQSKQIGDNAAITTSLICISAFVLVIFAAILSYKLYNNKKQSSYQMTINNQ